MARCCGRKGFEGFEAESVVVDFVSLSKSVGLEVSDDYVDYKAEHTTRTVGT